MDMFDFAGMLFGRAGTSQANSVTASGAAASDDGVASITLDADVTPAEDVGEDADQTVIDLPTSPDVNEGDELIVTLVGDGPLKTPIVTANPGSGDRMRAAVTSARSVADAAQAVADAINQHFWHDTSGAHVTEATQEEWEQSHSGPNSLWNSLGMLFRDGLNNLLALVTGQETGVAIYDGNGNDAENVVASFTGTEVSLGANSNSSTIDMCGGAFKFYIDTSDPDNVLASIRLAQEAVDHSTANAPVLRLLSGTSSSGTGIEVRGTNASQYPISVISYSGSSITRHVGFGTAGINTSVITLNSTNCEIYKDSTDDIIHIKATRVVLPVETVSLTRGSGASSWTLGQLKRSGNTVVVTVQDFKLASALASGSNSGTIATIPTGYRPDAVQRVPAALSVNGNYANVWAAIGTGGAIVLANHSGLSIPTTATISLNCCYIVN